jgi:fucose permease
MLELKESGPFQVLFPLYNSNRLYLVSIGGWIVTFMTKVRSASSFASATTATGFWAGQTVGRIGLSFFTAKLGEFPSVLLYLGICMGLELIFWFVPSLVVSAVGVALLGVFIGPLFPTAIIVVTKVLPRQLHVSSIGFGTALGGSGGAIIPFIVGAIAQAKGVRSLQPLIFAILATITGLWLFLWRLARLHKREELEEAVTGN